MSRNDDSTRRSVFRLSGNMALGGNVMPAQPTRGPVYSEETLSKAKNSLQLLKAKQAVNDSNTRSSVSKIPAPSNYTTGEYSGYPLQSRPPYDNVYQSYNSTSDNYPKAMNNSKPNYSEQNSLKSTQASTTSSAIGRSGKPPVQPKYDMQASNPPVRQKPINELKREQKLQIKEYAQDELIECSQGCGRKFNPQSIMKHEANCKKVFQQKRKQFNTQAQRIVAKEQVKLMKKGQQVEKKIEQKKKKQKIPKWKAESLAFRAILAQNNGNQTQMTAKEKADYQQAQQALKEASGFVKCNTCGRSFNEKAAQKHIPFCAEQAKKNAMKNNNNKNSGPQRR